MSINQWKLLIQLKDSLTKLSSDKNNFSKDFAQLIQKFPSTDLLKYFERTQLPVKTIETNNVPSVLKREPEKIEIKENAGGKVVEPKWKRTDLISKSTISSQTQHAILAIESAETDQSLINRLEAFVAHLKQYPEAKNSSIKIGAIRLLLKIRLNNPNATIQSILREGFALLGYTDPVPCKGIRILSMDGGGIRGLLILEMLKKLEELTGKRVNELFDLFCGVSTGAILSFSIGIHNKSLDEISEGYQQISNEVFKQSPIWGTGNLVWSHAYYDTSLWEDKLRKHLGDETLISTARNGRCPKLCAVSAVVNQSRLSAYIFRNYSLPWRVQSQYFGNSNYEVWQAARASAAAPTYFEEFRLGNFLHQDGGILVNNPTAVALHEAKLIWPNTPVQCIVSFGTGRIIPSMNSDVSAIEDKSSASTTSWANKFYKILDSATDTEGVHTTLNDLLPDQVYYRFNPYLTEMISMVETDPRKLEQLKRDAMMYLRRNEDKFVEVAKALVQKKSFLQTVKDYVSLKRDLYGF